jgi:hypothetical protein
MSECLAPQLPTPTASAGQVVVAQSGTIQAQQMLPLVTRIMDVNVTAGTWPILCDVEFHMRSGMIAQAVIT